MEHNDDRAKGMIIFESKYGATRQYAEWLGTALKLQVFTTDEITASGLSGADFLLIGTPVYATRFRIYKWLKRNVKKFDKKKLFFFIVNATAPGEQSMREKYIRENIPPEIKGNAAFYFLTGRLIHKDLSFFDRLMVAIGAKMEKDPEKRKAMHSDLDGVKKENLNPIIKAVNEFCFSTGLRQRGHAGPVSNSIKK